jgi:hypothetical protein
MRSVKILVLSVLACGLGACHLLPGTNKVAPEPVQKTAPVVAESVLYARDGSIVTPQGVAPGAGLPRREVQGAEDSRSKILELYQRVVEERDKLTLELTARDAEISQIRKTLELEVARSNEFEARVRTAEQTTAELCSQNLELAARLTTAQIRGLEAEKRWLELSLSLPAKTVASTPKRDSAPAAAPEKRPTEQH